MKPGWIEITVEGVIKKLKRNGPMEQYKLVSLMAKKVHRTGSEIRDVLIGMIHEKLIFYVDDKLSAREKDAISEIGMSRYRKLKSPVTLFAAIEEKDREALRQIAYEEKKSVADVVREIIKFYLNRIWEDRKLTKEMSPVACLGDYKKKSQKIKPKKKNS